MELVPPTIHVHAQQDGSQTPLRAIFAKLVLLVSFKPNLAIA
jgi:hypothetical protein